MNNVAGEKMKFCLYSPIRQHRFTAAAILISLTLVYTLRYALEQALFPVPVEVIPGVYDTLNLEERRFGWSQVAVIVLSGIITWIPFRRGEIWAWVSLWLYLFLFAYPVVLLPLRYMVGDWFLVGTITFWPMVLGLLIVLPDLLRRYRRATD